MKLSGRGCGNSKILQSKIPSQIPTSVTPSNHPWGGRNTVPGSKQNTDPQIRNSPTTICRSPSTTPLLCNPTLPPDLLTWNTANHITC